MLPIPAPVADLPVPASGMTAPAGPDDGAAWDALRAAAQVTADRFGHATRRSAACQAAAAWLVDAVHASAAGARPRAAAPRAEAPLHRMALHLRHEFLVAVEGGPRIRDAHAIVGILLAIEAVQLDLTQGNAAPERDLADELLGLHGRNLVVQIAHDMRSPLTSILFLVNTLRTGQSGPVGPVQERQLDLIYSSAFGLSALVNDVVELSQASDRMLEFEPIPFSIAEMLHGVRDVLQPIAEEKGLEMRIRTPAEDARLGYPAALGRVVLNLATNALKFTEQGWVAITARELSPVRLEISVEDTGYGVPRDVLEALFPAMRTRRRSTPTGFVGTGLGLGICRELVDAMGSTLQVERDRECGSRFYFELDLPPAPMTQ